MLNLSAIRYVQDIRSGAANLKNAISALSSGAAFRQQGAVSPGNNGSVANFAVNRVTDFVNAYNQLYTATLTKSNDPKANRLFSQLVSTSRTYAASLDRIGINFDQDGFMTINSERLNRAAEDGSLARFFTSTGNFGFSNQISRLADNVILNTAAFVSRSSFINNFAFSNPAAFNSQLTGMLINFWT